MFKERLRRGKVRLLVRVNKDRRGLKEWFIWLIVVVVSIMTSNAMPGGI